MNGAARYQIPREPGRTGAIALALAVHAALFAFLWIGVRWQSQTPMTIEAEVWSPVAQEAAPPPPPPPPPEPVVKEAPKPVPQVEKPIENPDIALEKEKRRKEQEKAEREEAERIEKQKRLADEKEAQKKKREQEEKERKLREDTMKRLMAQAGAAGSGTAAKAQGPRGDPEYGAKIRAKIRSNTTFIPPAGLENNPAVEYQVDLLPDGSIRRVQKINSSGIPAFDDAVYKAIEKSQPYPADKSGKVPSSIQVVHRPKDQ